MRRYKLMLPYLGIILVCYVAVLFMRFPYAVFLLPPVVFVCGLVYGLRHRFHWSYLSFAVAAGVLFIPIILIFMNETAWLYIVYFSVFTLAGSLVGKLLSLKAP